MTEQTPTRALEPCPFCGAGETQIHVNKGTWRGHWYEEPVSVEVRHWCTDVPGQPSRMISRAGRDEASAIAAWNTMAKWGSPVVAGEVASHRVMRKRLDGNWVCDGRYWSDGPPSKELVESICSDKDRWRVDVAYTTPQPTQAQAGAVPLTCEWTHNDDDGFWETACGEAWRFDDGGPGENSMHFCHSCGKSLRIKGGQHGTK